MPLFSIVMPTRNRAHLLQYALQSALAQRFDDYEIVASDNNSTDNTADTVHRIADRRVRYVHTGRTLAMPDSWDFALNHATGKYITYLCDDDAIRSDLLERLYPIVKNTTNISVGWENASYHHYDWPDEKERFRLVVPRTTGKIQELPSPSIIERMFALEYTDHFPRLLNSCCARAFLNERKRRMGRLFFPTCPDYSVAVATLTGMDHILFIDEPLVVFGRALASNGSFGFKESNSSQIFLSEFPDLRKLWRIPLSSPTHYNHIAVTLIALKEVLAQELAPYSMSVLGLFIRDYEMLKLMEARGADVREMLQQWHEALATQNAETQQSVRDLTLAKPNLQTVIRERFPTVARALASVKTILTGRMAEYRCDNILEATKVIEKLACASK